MIDRVQRINWIDWSKVFAIYLVALGHLLGNTGMEGYLHNCIYLFHMPFFFFVSGYLLKSNDQKFEAYLKQSFKKLIVPYILLNLIGNAFLIPTWILSHKWPVEQLFYFITADGHGEPGPTWFLVCLFWVRLIAFPVLRLRILGQVIIIALSGLIAYIFPYHLYWRIDVAFMALPFFLIGNILRKKDITFFSQGTYFIVFGGIIVLFSYFMGDCNIYSRHFGNYPYLYYPCAISGIFMLISFCSLFGRYCNRIIVILSSGTILIMALHGIVFLYIITLFRYCGSIDYVFLSTWGKLLLAGIAIVLLYYPIVWFQKHYNIVLGGRG